MTITVRFSGPIRRPWPEASRGLEVAEGTTVGELLGTLGFAGHALALLHAAVNGATASLRSALADGNVVDIMLRVGGG